MYMVASWAVEVTGILSQRSFFCARTRVTSQTQLAEFAHVRKTKLKMLPPPQKKNNLKVFLLISACLIIYTQDIPHKLIINMSSSSQKKSKKRKNHQILIRVNEQRNKYQK